MDKYFFTMLATALGSPWDWATTNILKFLGDYWGAIVGLIVSSLAACTFNCWKDMVGDFWNSHVWVHVRYLTCYKEEVLKRMKDDLDPKRRELERKKKDNYIIPPNGIDWLDDVKKLEQDLDAIPADVTPWFNLSKRYGEGKKVAECTKKIDELIKRHSNIILTGNKHGLARVPTKKASTSTSSTSIYKDFQSREVIFSGVLNALNDNKIHRIGICGMGGVGKTTMKDDLRRTANVEHLFDYIIDTTVGQDQYIKDIQQKIAYQLKHEFKTEDENFREEELREKYKEYINGKKVLVIFDDVWLPKKNTEKPVDLKKLGLSPLPVGFKMLLTTRFVSVCIDMGVEEPGIFRMGSMPVHEAWNLFQQITQISSNADRELYKIGEQIVERCRGLPLAIKTIARTLHKKGKKLSVWDDMLSKLSDKMLEELGVFDVLKVSYDFLNDNDAKEIFLLCCLYPEDSDIPIEDLVRYAVGLRFFEDLDPNRKIMEGIRNRTDSCIETLKDVSFLVDSDKAECVKVHDLVREFGQTHVHFNTKGEQIVHRDISEWQDIESLSGIYTSMSLDCNLLGALPDRPRCPNLQFLNLAAGYRKKLNIPLDFFQGMEKLEVLAFKYMESPLSLGPLQVHANLRSLSLHSTSVDLDALRIIGNLRNLEILSFAGSGIRHLPEEIGNLSLLRVLDLTGFEDLQIDDNVLPRLQKLEELYMLGEGMLLTDANRSDLVILLEKLTALQFEFGDDTIPMNHVTVKNLKRFKVSVGSNNELYEGISNADGLGNTLIFIIDGSEQLARDMNVLFGSTEILFLQVKDLISLEVTFNLDSPCVFGNLKRLELNRCHQMKNAFSFSKANNLSRLEELFIESCNMLEEVVDQVEKSENRMIKFPKLKILALRGLPNLVGFCRSADVVELPQLEELRLERLSKITCIYPQSSSSAKVDNSTVLPSLFNQQVPLIKFPKLRILVLSGLPKLVGFCRSADVVELPQLEELHLEGLPKITSIYPHSSAAKVDNSTMRSLFNQQVTITKLKSLNINEMESLMEIWPSKSRIDSVCAPKILEVNYCEKLTNIFPANAISHLNDLEKLNVTKCNSLEVVFNLQQEANDVHDQSQGAQSSMFWGPTPSADQFRGLQTLRSIQVEYCRSLRHLFKPSISDTPLQLESLFIQGCENFVAIDSNESFRKSISRKMERPNTEELAIDIDSPIDKIVAMFPSHLMQRFCRLKTLTILHSQSLPEVVFEMEQTDSGQASATQGLNELEELVLSGLSTMTHVWKWKKAAVRGGGLVFVEGFQNLTSLILTKCGNIKYLFTPSMGKALVKLQTLKIWTCEQMEVVVSDREEKETFVDSIFFPCLVDVYLEDLPNLKCIGARSGITSNDGASRFQISNQKLGIGPAQDATSALCNSKLIKVKRCHELLHVIPSYAIERLQMLEELTIEECKMVEEVFEPEGLNIEGSSCITIPMLKKLSLQYLCSLKHIWWRRNDLVLLFPVLKELKIHRCDDMTHIFTCSMVASFRTLETLRITGCEKMQEIVMEENEEVEAAAAGANKSMREIRFNCLKFLKLQNLPNLGAVSSAAHHGFQWPQLDDLEIIDCPEMRMFTYCHSAGPKVWKIKTRHGLEEDQDINSFVQRKTEEGFRF